MQYFDPLCHHRYGWIVLSIGYHGNYAGWLCAIGKVKLAAQKGTAIVLRGNCLFLLNNAYAAGRPRYGRDQAIPSHAVQIQMLLGMDVMRVTGDKKNKGQLSIFDFAPEQDPYVQEMIERYDRFGAVNLDRLRADFPRLRIANEVAQQQKFFHWELEFADVFDERDGFDLIIGNPPWVKMEWNEQAVMGDRQPLFAVKNFTANQTAQVRSETLKNSTIRSMYFSEYTEMSGTQAYLNATQN